MSKLQKRGYVINTAVLVVLFALFMLISGSLGGTDSFKLILVPSIWQCCYLIILAASLNLVLGFLGQLSLGHCGFMAIGAYTAALMSLAFQRAGVYDEKSGAVFIAIIFLCIIAAGLLAAVIGAVVSIPRSGSRATTSPSSRSASAPSSSTSSTTCPSPVRTASRKAPPRPHSTPPASASALRQGHVHLGRAARHDRLHRADVHVHPL
ncbi:MAG: ABC transporter permease subunit [Oscillospiraceae bacterium]